MLELIFALVVFPVVLLLARDAKRSRVKEAQRLEAEDLDRRIAIYETVTLAHLEQAGIYVERKDLYRRFKQECLNGSISRQEVREMLDGPGGDAFSAWLRRHQVAG